MSHTKEPWEAFCDVCESSTPHPDSEPIVRIGFDDYVRARACVNACAGIPTEHLERCNAIGAVDEIIAERNELKKQRDELLAALEGLITVCEIALSGKGGFQHTYFETRDGHFVEATKAMQEAEAAIARAKGGTA